MATRRVLRAVRRRSARALRSGACGPDRSWAISSSPTRLAPLSSSWTACFSNACASERDLTSCCSRSSLILGRPPSSKQVSTGRRPSQSAAVRAGTSRAAAADGGAGRPLPPGAPGDGPTEANRPRRRTPPRCHGGVAKAPVPGCECHNGRHMMACCRGRSRRSRTSGEGPGCRDSGTHVREDPERRVIEEE